MEKAKLLICPIISLLIGDSMNWRIFNLTALIGLTGLTGAAIGGFVELSKTAWMSWVTVALIIIALFLMANRQVESDEAHAEEVAKKVVAKLKTDRTFAKNVAEQVCKKIGQRKTRTKVRKLKAVPSAQTTTTPLPTSPLAADPVS